jgi:hypothetical protein
MGEYVWYAAHPCKQVHMDVQTAVFTHVMWGEAVVGPSPQLKVPSHDHNALVVPHQPTLYTAPLMHSKIALLRPQCCNSLCSPHRNTLYTQAHYASNPKRIPMRVTLA